MKTLSARIKGGFVVVRPRWRGCNQSSTRGPETGCSLSSPRPPCPYKDTGSSSLNPAFTLTCFGRRREGAGRGCSPPVPMCYICSKKKKWAWKYTRCIMQRRRMKKKKRSWCAFNLTQIIIKLNKWSIQHIRNKALFVDAICKIMPCFLCCVVNPKSKASWWPCERPRRLGFNPIRYAEISDITRIYHAW